MMFSWVNIHLRDVIRISGKGTPVYESLSFQEEVQDKNIDIFQGLIDLSLEFVSKES